MALYVQLKNTNIPRTFGVQAESIEHSGTRPGAIANALPADFVMMLELGGCLEQITVSGTCEEGAATGGNSQAPTKLDLREALKEWWDTAPNNRIQMVINDNETYNGQIKNFNFRMTQAQEDRWTISFVFVVYEKV